MCKPELLRGRLERGPGRCWRGRSSSGRGDEFSRRDLHPINIASRLGHDEQATPQHSAGLPGPRGSRRRTLPPEGPRPGTGSRASPGCLPRRSSLRPAPVPAAASLCTPSRHAPHSLCCFLGRERSLMCPEPSGPHRKAPSSGKPSWFHRAHHPVPALSRSTSPSPR